MSELATLPRIDVSKELQERKCTPDADFNDKVVELLNYKCLDSHLRHYQDEMTLLAAFAAEGIRPFQTEAVLEYQKQKAETSIFELRKHPVWMGIVSIVGMTFVASCVWGDPGSSLGVAVVGGLGCAIATGVTWENFVPKYVWKREYLAGYDQHVPLEVLDLACHLKERIPNSRFSALQFEVESLREEERPIYDDPFLIVRLGTASFYIAAWEEAGFQAKYE